MLRAAFLLLFGMGIAVQTLPARAEIAGHAEVVDGNTLKLNGQTLVLFGINAPSMHEYCQTRRGETYPCGEAASRTLKVVMQNKDVVCTEKGPDHRGVMRVICTVDGADLNRVLILNGWAVAY
ncbi:MAG: thermonuclease family protein, partial [Rhodospirillales bacterium]|nr:thermonuclease family protein [Rhodospirillales bacterium]